MIYHMNGTCYLFDHKQQLFVNEYGEALSHDDCQAILHRVTLNKNLVKLHFDEGHTRYVHVLERNRDFSQSVMITPDSLENNSMIVRTSYSDNGIINQRKEHIVNIADARYEEVFHALNLRYSINSGMDM